MLISESDAGNGSMIVLNGLVKKTVAQRIPTLLMIVEPTTARRPGRTRKESAFATLEWMRTSSSTMRKISR